MNENSYYITLGTYGTRLHGGTAPTARRSQNKSDDPIPFAANRTKMTETPLRFTDRQRQFVESVIPELCVKGNWTFHIAACQPDHVHLLVSSHADPKDIRRCLKTWLVQRLNEAYGKRRWFARDGSIKGMSDEDDFNAATQYIAKRRATVKFSEEKSNEPRPVTAELQTAPAERSERDRIRAQIENLPPEETLTRSRLEELARSLVRDESHLAWTMVLIGARFWRNRVTAIPYEKRLLLLPHCMRHSGACPAQYDPEGLQCEHCGLCELGVLKAEAESLGCHVMIAEGSPIVMQWILSGKADAILGIGCLRSLERAFEKLQLAGIPAMAVPLHEALCKDSTTDIDRVREMIQTPYIPADPEANERAPQPTWLHLLRGAGRLFTPLAENSTQNVGELDLTEHLSEEYLRRGGKNYRPFIVLATYDALTGSLCTGPDGERQVENLPVWVKEGAAAIEIFHKASLIHDDIEDDDPFRYGLPTLHRTHGIPLAINVGDYMLGRGYRIVAKLYEKIPGSKRIVPGEIVAEAIARLGRAHLLLSQGQGAELAWKSRDLAELTPSDVLRIYVLKTSPAFAAALELGVLFAVASSSVDWTFYRSMEKTLSRFSRHLGVAFQVKNDLDDWQPDRLNKRIAGGDMLNHRPTLLRALAGNVLDGPQQRLEDAFLKLHESGVLDKARKLIRRHAEKARETAEEIDHIPFRRLLFHFVDTIAE